MNNKTAIDLEDDDFTLGGNKNRHKQAPQSGAFNEKRRVAAQSGAASVRAREREEEQDEFQLATPADRKPKKKINKWNVFLIVGGVSLVAGVVCLLVAFLAIKSNAKDLGFPTLPSGEGENTYSLLTGEPLEKADLLNAPAFCIQTPNGTDGARPQAGLNQAGVIFEAIAEAGITRFAAIYQDPTSAVIGPIRSMRSYYLEWDAPFDCTLVHAGGSGDALATLEGGDYKDLSEDYNYMYRGTYTNRLWNNLFTSATLLKKAGQEIGKGKSEIKGFPRLTPKESDKERAEMMGVKKLNITESAEGDTSSEAKVKVPEITLDLGGNVAFDVNYAYDADSNTYKRSYGDGKAHEVYNCKDEDLGEVNPEDACELKQMAPAVVVAMIVEESRAADGYHEDITTTGSGKAYIFQNGDVIEGTWGKTSAKDQIKFKDGSGEEIKLAPGQTIITAIPKYGSVDF